VGELADLSGRVSDPTDGYNKGPGSFADASDLFYCALPSTQMAIIVLVERALDEHVFSVKLLGTNYPVVGNGGLPVR
jgi:hypothetical protein